MISPFLLLALAVTLVGPGMTIEVKPIPMDRIQTFDDGSDVRAAAALARDGYYRKIRDEQDRCEWHALRLSVSGDEIAWNESWILTVESEFEEWTQVEGSDIVLAECRGFDRHEIPFANCNSVTLERNRTYSVEPLDWGGKIMGAVRLPIGFGEIKSLRLEVVR